jgi:hypothetical protein
LVTKVEVIVNTQVSVQINANGSFLPAGAETPLKHRDRLRAACGIIEELNENVIGLRQQEATRNHANEMRGIFRGIRGANSLLHMSGLTTLFLPWQRSLSR